MRLHHLFEDENVKKEIISKVSGLVADNEDDAKLLDKIYRTLHNTDISGKVAQAFAVPTSDDNINLEPLLKQLTQIIFHAGVDYKSLDQFLNRLEKGNVVDVPVLTTPGVGSVRAFFGGDETTTKIFQAMATLGAGKKQKGPGEYALAMLSNQIKLKHADGDLEVAGKGIEVKAETTSGGGRLGEGGPSNAVAKEYWSQVPSIANHFNQGSKGLGIKNFVQALALDLPLNDPEKKKQRQDLLTKWYSQLFPNAGPFVQAFMQDDGVVAEKMYGKANFESYKNNYGWDGLLSINFPSLKYVMVNTGDDFVRMKEAGHFGSFSISVVPSSARPSEVYCQLSLTKAKA
tara:strand:- start:2861 stop:3895 length:1035 start_codon:yes stop_codon:yes gene_type:complete